MTSSRTSTRSLGLLSALLLLPALAQAHPGHGPHHFAAGAAHPLEGLDHLLAMLAVGLWASQLGRRAWFLVPMAFLALMAVGGAVGMTGVHLPFVTQGVVASVFLLGLLIATSCRLPLLASVGVVSLFAFCHGYAHGQELLGQSNVAPFAAGLFFSTALLHACGLACGLMLRVAAQSIWLRAAGVAIMVGGFMMALG